MTHAEIGESLLAAILDDPTDDARRLIYADWLEEHFDPETPQAIRAAMMRGVTFKNMEGGILSRAFPELKLLVDRFGLEVWVDDERWRYANKIGPPIRDDTYRVIFRKGFLELIRCPLQAWLDHGPAIATRHPIARIETERRPYPAGKFYWWFRGNSRNEHELPEEVFGTLTGQDATAGRIVYTFRGAGGWPSGKGHDSAADALDALSDALLALARSQVVPAGAETVS